MTAWWGFCCCGVCNEETCIDAGTLLCDFISVNFGCGCAPPLWLLRIPGGTVCDSLDVSGEIYLRFTFDPGNACWESVEQEDSGRTWIWRLEVSESLDAVLSLIETTSGETVLATFIKEDFLCCCRNSLAIDTTCEGLPETVCVKPWDVPTMPAPSNCDVEPEDPYCAEMPVMMFARLVWPGCTYDGLLVPLTWDADELWYQGTFETPYGDATIQLRWSGTGVSGPGVIDCCWNIGFRWSENCPWWREFIPCAIGPVDDVCPPTFWNNFSTAASPPNPFDNPLAGTGGVQECYDLTLAEPACTGSDLKIIVSPYGFGELEEEGEVTLPEECNTPCAEGGDCPGCVSLQYEVIESGEMKVFQYIGPGCGDCYCPIVSDDAISITYIDPTSPCDTLMILADSYEIGNVVNIGCIPEDCGATACP